MLRHSAIGAAAILLSMPGWLDGAKWLRIESPHFELYTTDDAKSGREAVQHFEQVRSAFIDILGIKLVNKRPVSIVAFRNPDEYAPYRIHDNVAAYYMASPRHDFIVIGDLAVEHHSFAVHEYTHLVIDQAGLKLPLWLNEGFAEIYSTMRVAGNKILVGRIIPERLNAAQSGSIDLREILTATRNSAVYTAPGQQSIFYGESWALVHMLKFSKPYAQGIDRFLDAVGRGEPSESALERIYRKPLAEIQTDLNAYIHSDKFNEGVIKAKLANTDVDPTVSEADPTEITLILAEVQYGGPKHEDSVRTLRSLCLGDRGNLRACETLAWLSLAQHPQEAVDPFRRALQLKTQDAALCRAFAARLMQAGSSTDALAALRWAAEIAPEDSETQEMLAAYAMLQKDYAEAFLRLRLVKKLDKSRAFAYYKALAFSAYQIGKVEEAKTAATRVRQYASTEQEHAIGEQLWSYVNGSGVPPAPR
jgi:tetratricopeptide (TPR) repeat protein